MRSLLALLLLTACSDPPAAAQGQPAAPATPALPRRTAPPIPPRLLHPTVRDFAALPGGDLLVVLHDGSVRTLDVQSGKTTPWPLPWRPTDLGWRNDDEGPHAGDRVRAIEVSLDGRWLALAIPFSPGTPRGAPSSPLLAVVVTRTDASDTRCLYLTTVDETLEISGDSARIVGRLPFACEPDRRNAPTAIVTDRQHRPRWFDLRDGSHHDVPEHLDLHHGHCDPLGDAVLDSSPRCGVRFYSSSTGADIGRAELPGPLHRFHAWVRSDAVHVTHGESCDDAAIAGTLTPHDPGHVIAGDRRATSSDAIVFTDGRVVPFDPDLTIYTRLPGDEILFNEATRPPSDLRNRDEGGTFHQGRLDWQHVRVAGSIPRDDLAGRTAPRMHGPIGPVRYTWTPALGGLLIHRAPDGPLEWAGL